MVLESLFNPFSVKKRPWEMFVAGFFYSFVGLFLSYFVFRDSAGLLMVFLIVLAALPIFYTTINNEEELVLKSNSELSLLKEHTKILMFLTFFFLGIITALSLAYIILPGDMVNSIFSFQHQAIGNVNNAIQGNLTKVDVFWRILLNNIKVLFFCIVFSFLYGTGALFILTWNSSVVSAAIGNLFKTRISDAVNLAGIPVLSSYLSAISFSFLRYNFIKYRSLSANSNFCFLERFMQLIRMA